jgi:AcrR family transcriptional regulator
MSTLDALHDPAAPVVGRPTRDGSQSDAARRILAAAGPRFYLDGIRTVSADAVMAEAGVTKATFYRHFPTKDDLVAAYLHTLAQVERATVAGWRAAHRGDPLAVLSAYADSLGAQVCGPAFRGCPFLNAQAEYPDPASPVRQVVDEHRRWLRTTTAQLLDQYGLADPEGTALQLVMLRDGAATGGGDPAEVARALRVAGQAVIAAATRRSA